jgi:ketosteroid isomerase-like protein
MSANVEVVRAWHRAAQESRTEDVLALTHTEFEMVEAAALPGATRVKGVEALRRYGRGWARNWSKWEWLEEEVIELPPDRVVYVATLRLRGLRSSIWVEHRWAYLITLRDGLILRNDGYESKDEVPGLAAG